MADQNSLKRPSAHEQRKIARLNAREEQTAKRRYNREQQAQQAQVDANIAAAANNIDPNATTIVAQALQDPTVNNRNFMQWARDKLAPHKKELMIALLASMLHLYIASLLRQEASVDEEWWHKYHPGINSDDMRMGGHSRWFYAPCDAGGVANAVFASYEHSLRPNTIKDTGVAEEGSGDNEDTMGNALDGDNADTETDDEEDEEVVALRADLGKLKAELARHYLDYPELEAEVEEMQKVAAGLLEKALQDPNVNTGNFKPRVRGQLSAMRPSASSMGYAAQNVLVTAMYFVFVLSLYKPEVVQKMLEQLTLGYSFVLDNSQVSAPANGGSVVDAVFAQAKRKAAAR